MFTKIEALIGRKHDDGIVIQSIILELLNQATDILIDTRNAGKLVAHIGLVFGTHQRLAF